MPISATMIFETSDTSPPHADGAPPREPHEEEVVQLNTTRTAGGGESYSPGPPHIPFINSSGSSQAHVIGAHPRDPQEMGDTHTPGDPPTLIRAARRRGPRGSRGRRGPLGGGEG